MTFSRYNFFFSIHFFKIKQIYIHHLRNRKEKQRKNYRKYEKKADFIT